MIEKKEIDLGACINVSHLWRGILDSYHNYYDIFSELVQNSVDSLRKSRSSNPSISLSYNNNDQIIEVTDNGQGMSESDLAFFALGNTNKIDEVNSIGEKGLGASFILGISDDFYLETVKDGEKIIATCENAYSTISDGVVPKLNYSVQDDDSSSYCRIRVKISSVDMSIDSIDRLKFILRTRTAIGNTKNLFLAENDREKIKIEVEYRNDSTLKNEIIPFLYLHFDEVVKGTYPIFDAIQNSSNRKWIVDETEIKGKPRGVLRLIDYTKKIYVTFAEASIYEKFGNIIGDTRFPEDIVISIKGCPTSVEVNKPRLGNAGYYTNLHIVIEGDEFSLDAGRKTITRENGDQVREKIKSFFSDVVKYSNNFIGTPHDAIGEGAGLDQIKKRAQDTDDLKISGIPFAKVPRHEQSVVAIFHELLGAKIISGYKTLLVSQYNTFDILFRYETAIENIGKNPRDIFLKSAGKSEKTFTSTTFGEFKLSLGKFCDDVNRDIKAMDHVSLVICWDKGNNFSENGWEFRKTYPDEFVYNGANYILEKIGHKKVHVMLLEDFNSKI